MQQWLGGSMPEGEDIPWSKSQDTVESLLEKFRAVPAEQIALLPNFDDTVWNTAREALWRPVTLLWVVSKTYQHTAEHINDVMRIGLFWDSYVAG
jgi:hypothetical protein